MYVYFISVDMSTVRHGSGETQVCSEAVSLYDTDTMLGNNPVVEDWEITLSLHFGNNNWVD